jgi:hypothetical protein
MNIQKGESGVKGFWHREGKKEGKRKVSKIF